MDKSTRIEIEKCFLDVSRAAARKKLYAMRAEQEGNIQLADFFVPLRFRKRLRPLAFCSSYVARPETASKTVKMHSSKRSPPSRINTNMPWT